MVHCPRGFVCYLFRVRTRLENPWISGVRFQGLQSTFCLDMEQILFIFLLLLFRRQLKQVAWTLLLERGKWLCTVLIKIFICENCGSQLFPVTLIVKLRTIDRGWYHEGDSWSAFFFPWNIKWLIFFLVNRDFHSSRKEWFCKIIFRETRNKCLIRRWPWFHCFCFSWIVKGPFHFPWIKMKEKKMFIESQNNLSGTREKHQVNSLPFSIDTSFL